MSVQIGDPVPDMDIMVKGDDGIDTVNLSTFTEGRRVIIFVVPGAFTPTCSAKHVPSFLHHYDALRSAGIDAIACLSVNDAHVMKVWGEDQKVGDKITMMADIRGTAAEALGLLVDMGPVMGLRAGRAAFVIHNGKITHKFVEEPAIYEVSSAEHILAAITTS